MFVSRGLPYAVSILRGGCLLAWENRGGAGGSSPDFCFLVVTREGWKPQQTMARNPVMAIGNVRGGRVGMMLFFAKSWAVESRSLFFGTHVICSVALINRGSRLCPTKGFDLLPLWGIWPFVDERPGCLLFVPRYLFVGNAV